MRNFNVTFNNEENCVTISPTFNNYPRLCVYRRVDKHRDDISVDFSKNSSCGDVRCEESKSVSRDSEIVRFVIERSKEVCGCNCNNELQPTADFNWNLALEVFSFLGIGL